MSDIDLHQLADTLDAQANALHAQAVALRGPRRRAAAPSAPAPSLLTVPQAAAALSISRTTLYEVIRSGRLRTVRVGSRRLVPVTATQEFVARLAS